MTSPTKAAKLLRDTYEIYAKLLAVENITVVFDEAISAPAQFDILNRVLYISPVHGAQDFLIPGLVIHEVGHALFSLLSEDEAKKIKSISRLLNIIDDGYQERKTCKKYANAKKHLFTVFDYFFLREKNPLIYNNPNKLISIVNTLNYNCKGFKHGYYKDYPNYVLPEDLDLLREAEMLDLDSLMERWEFSKVLSKALKKYGEMEDEGTDLDTATSKKKKKKDKADSEDSEDREKQEADGDGGGPLLDDEDDSDEDDSPDEKGPHGGQGKEEDEDPIEKELDDNKDALNDHHQKFKHKMNGKATYELPTGPELLSLCQVKDIFPDKANPLEGLLEEAENHAELEFYKLCLKNSKLIANQIFTKFNMRVQANNFANTSFKNSGMLDPERAALYKVYDDVFQKHEVIPNQQNHAYSIVLDWSGSMDSSVFPLCLRIMELIYFAKSANIEIEVWLYTSATQRPANHNIPRNLTFNNPKLIKVVNTKKDTPTNIDLRIKSLWILSYCISHRWRPKNAKAGAFIGVYSTSGTNVLEGLIVGHHVLSKMQADKKTCFVLTDGDDASVMDYTYNARTGQASFGGEYPKIYVNGMDVDSLYSFGLTRHNATRAIADMYLSIGQRTTGIAWNCSGGPMEEWAQNVVSCHNNYTQPYQYIHASNIFINEIVKNLL